MGREQFSMLWNESTAGLGIVDARRRVQATLLVMPPIRVRACWSSDPITACRSVAAGVGASLIPYLVLEIYARVRSRLQAITRDGLRRRPSCPDSPGKLQPIAHIQTQ